MKGFKPEYQNKTHGQCCSRFYNTWNLMRQRCYSLTWSDYHRYGGRGITICDEWRNTPVEFIKWCEIQNPTKGLTLDRKDNNGPYAPWNCRFVTRKEQARNTRRNRLVTYQGKVYVLKELFDKFSIVKKKTFETRLARGWDIHDALTVPARLCK